MAKADTIQTLHPDPAKTNKVISEEKYHFIRKHLLAILKHSEPTQLEMMGALHEQVKDHFDGSPHWYGETVKLDLEARGLVERTGKKPVRYRLSTRKK
jgi:hypothetical protein